jgi:hypothetical protein
MNRILLALCTLAAAVPAALPAQPADAHAPVRVTGLSTKVTAPVDVQIVPLPEPGPGRRRVRIVARPDVDAASLTIDVSAESGLVLASPADGSWTVPARAGEEVAREVELAVSGPGELRLVVTATVKHGEDFTQTGIHVFAFEPGPAADAALAKSLLPGVSTDPGGRTILEVPARRP